MCKILNSYLVLIGVKEYDAFALGSFSQDGVTSTSYIPRKSRR